MIIAHISDVHIRKTRRHEEYRIVLDNLISSGDEILDAKTVTAWFRAKQFLDKL